MERGFCSGEKRWILGDVNRTTTFLAFNLLENRLDDHFQSKDNVLNGPKLLFYGPFTLPVFRF